LGKSTTPPIKIFDDVLISSGIEIDFKKPRKRCLLKPAQKLYFFEINLSKNV
jgi:hypothetical protein